MSLPLATDHAMAWHHDGQGIASVGGAHRPYRGGATDRVGDVAIRARGAIRNGAQRSPHVLLKGRTARGERQGEAGAGSLEVRLELCLSIAQHVWDGVVGGTMRGGGGACGAIAVQQLNPGEPVGPSFHQEGAHRAIELYVGHGVSIDHRTMAA